MIRRNVFAAFGIALDAKYYRGMPKDAKKRMGNGDPFLFCFVRLLGKVAATLKRKGHEYSITMVFDDDKNYAMRCYGLWCELKKVNPELGKAVCAMCFADDTVIQPLHGADILAYETNKFLRGLVEKRNPRSTFVDLLRSPNPPYGIEYISEVWDKEGLDRIDKQLQDSSVLLN